jgi:uncharacterized membrane protein YfcA
MADLFSAYFGLSATGLDAASLMSAGLIVLFGYTVYGMMGFGSNIVAMPMLTQFIPLRTAVPLLMVFDLCTGLLLGVRNRASIDVGELRRIVPWIVIGALAGLAALVWAPERPLLLVLGTGVLAYSVWRLVSNAPPRPLGPRWAVPLGLGGGGFTALFGTGGPLYTIYLAGRIGDRDKLRATLSSLITLTGVLRVVLFTVAGLFLNPALPALALWLLPCGLLGMRLGSHLRGRLAPAKVARLLWIVLIIGSASLIVRALHG